MSSPDADTLIIEPLPIVQPDETRVQLTLNPGDTILYHPLLRHGYPTALARPLRAIGAHFAASECDYVQMTGHEQLQVQHLARTVICRARN